MYDEAKKEDHAGYHEFAKTLGEEQTWSHKQKNNFYDEGEGKGSVGHDVSARPRETNVAQTRIDDTWASSRKGEFTEKGGREGHAWVEDVKTRLSEVNLNSKRKVETINR